MGTITINNASVAPTSSIEISNKVNGCFTLTVTGAEWIGKYKLYAGSGSSETQLGSTTLNSSTIYFPTTSVAFNSTSGQSNEVVDNVTIPIGTYPNICIEAAGTPTPNDIDGDGVATYYVFSKFELLNSDGTPFSPEKSVSTSISGQ